jgi:beta-hydroxylase
MSPATLPLATGLGVWIGAALYVHWRGRERLSFMRQLADHSTLLAPYNAFVYLCSAVPRRPRLDVEQFPELRVLRDHWQTIRDEGLALHAAGHVRVAERHNDLAFNSFYKRDWRRFYVKWYGRPLPSATSLCPHTVELLAQTPSVHAAMFALLAPKSHLVRHRDPFAGSLRFHLGLSTPNSHDCRIFIDGEPYHWSDGEGVVFDETYIHRAENRTDVPRLILFCDVERPLRTRLATAINRFAIHRVMGITATANVDGEPVGLANRIFERVYGVRLLMKRLRKRSRRLYYALSWGTKLGVLALLVWLVLR